MSSTKSLVSKNKKKNLLNRMRKTHVKNLMKKFFLELDKGASDVSALMPLFSELQSKIMKAVAKGVFTKNYGSRKVSVLFKKLKQLSV